MIGKIVVKKFSEMKKEDEELYFPKTLNCSYVDQDLELLSKDYIKSLILQNKSQLTINEYGRTISHFFNFCHIYLGTNISSKDLEDFQDIDFLAYQSFYLGKSKTYETLKEEMINSYYTFENKKPNNARYTIWPRRFSRHHTRRGEIAIESYFKLAKKYGIAPSTFAIQSSP